MFRRLLWGSITARRGRMALALLAVALGSGMSIALGTLALQVGDDVARQLRAAGPNFLIQPRGATWAPDLGGAEIPAARVLSTLPDSTVAMLKRTFWKHNILHASPELAVAARAGESRFRLIGAWFRHDVPIEEGVWRTGLTELHPSWRIEGRWPREGTEEVALGGDLADRLGLASGGTLALEAGGEPLTLTVAGVVRAGGPEDAAAWAPLPLVQRIARRSGEVERVWMSALVLPGREAPPPDPQRDPKGYERYMCTAYPTVVAADLSARLPGAEVLPATERIAGEGRIVGRLTLLMVLLALAAIAASTLGLLSTMTTAVVERSTELALLRAIGASPGQLAGLLLAETLLVSLVGGVAGWWLGSAGAAAIRGASFVGAAVYQPLLLPVALAVAGLVGLLGTLGPLRVALRLDPARVLRG